MRAEGFVSPSAGKVAAALSAAVTSIQIAGDTRPSFMGAQVRSKQLKL